MNSACFNLTSIKLVVMCADCGSIALGAKRVHISKSAASERIATLESALQAPLFMRDHLGVRPTTTGAVFIDGGRSVLAAVRALEAALAAVEPPDPRLDWRLLRSAPEKR